MTKAHPLSADPRQLTGRKVKQLRSQGLIPANIFGSQVDSLSIQISNKDFITTYEQVGDTGLIDLNVSGEKNPRPVLVHLVQAHPVNNQVVHVDFRQVDLTKKITAQVPVELIGESVAVNQKGGILVQTMDEVEVEALPADLPDKLTLDISTLKEIGDSLHVSDLQVDHQKVTILTDHGSVVALAEAQKAEEVAPAPAATPEAVEATKQKGDKEEPAAEPKPEQKKE